MNSNSTNIPISNTHTLGDVAKAAIKLMRWHQPVGFWLLLWPTLWALWCGANGQPSLPHILIFALGAFVMRSAGCVVNDIADRNVDKQVKRTEQRPLAQGRITVYKALGLLAALLICALSLLALLPVTVVPIALVAAVLAMIYPLMKRITHFPQVVLGLAFSTGVLMAYVAEKGSLDGIAWGLFIANVFFTLCYDTLYAMADKEDDLKIGVKSTAILFGRWDWHFCVGFFGVFLICLSAVGVYLALSVTYWLGVCAAALLGGWILWSCADKQPQHCFLGFKKMHWVGFAVFLGLLGAF